MDLNFEMADETYKSDIYRIYRRAIKESDDYSEKREDALLFSKSEMPEKLYKKEGNRTIVAKKNDEIVGWSSLMTGESALDGLFVEPRHQGYGIGSSILSRTERLAKSEGLNQIILMTNPGTERFYLSNGYNRVGEGMVPGICSDDEIFCIALMKQLSQV